MAQCTSCGQEMLEAEKCTAESHVTIQGADYRRDTSYYDVNDRCHDCGIVNKPGNMHHPGCDIERCPKCGGQAISCGCYDEEDGETE